MGRRPIELTEAETAEVETLAAVLSTEQIADYFGIGRRTFWDLMARDPEIAARYKRGKARAIGAIAQGLITKARTGDTASMIFFLKTQGGWREALPPEAPPALEETVLDLEGVSDELLHELLDLMRRHREKISADEGRTLIMSPEAERRGGPDR